MLTSKVAVEAIIHAHIPPHKTVAVPNVFERAPSSVDNWELLSFVLNGGIVIQIRVGWFRLRYTSTLFLSSGSYVCGLSTG